MNKKRFGTGSTGDHAEQDTDVDVPIDDILEQSRSLFEAMEEDEKRIRSGEQPISPDQLNIVRWWVDVASGNKRFPQQFAHFIALWEAFNGWMRLRLNPRNRRRGDKRILGELADEPQLQRIFDDLMNDQRYRAVLKELEQMCPIYNVWGGYRTGRSYNISEPYKLKSVLNTVYQIRCNLFHGQKGWPQRDLKLASLSYRVLHPLFTQARKERGLTFVPIGLQTSGE